MKRRGFTLLEVLIATAVFAVISAITFQGLQTSMNVQERVEGRAQELVEIQLVWTVLFQDFMNMTRRPVREEGRDTPYPAFDLNPEDDGDCIVSFTRAGLPPSASLPAGMQRLAYCVRGDDLYRLVWPVLDRSSDAEAQESLLMEDVSEFVVETYPEDFDPDVERDVPEGDSEDGAGAGSAARPTTGTTTTSGTGQARSDAARKLEELPVGVKVTIEARDQTFVRLFPGGEEYRLDIDDR